MNVYGFVLCKVCGSDNTTYRNLCALQGCGGPGLEARKPGLCPGDPELAVADRKLTARLRLWEPRLTRCRRVRAGVSRAGRAGDRWDNINLRSPRT